MLNYDNNNYLLSLFRTIQFLLAKIIFHSHHYKELTSNKMIIIIFLTITEFFDIFIESFIFK